MLQRNALDAAREVDLPVLALGLGLFFRRQVVPPAELLQQLVVELRVAGLDLAADRMRAVAREQVDAVLLDAETGAEGAAAVHHRLARCRTGSACPDA